MLIITSPVCFWCRVVVGISFSPTTVLENIRARPIIRLSVIEYPTAKAAFQGKGEKDAEQVQADEKEKQHYAEVGYMLDMVSAVEQFQPVRADKHTQCHIGENNGLLQEKKQCGCNSHSPVN